MTPASGNFAVGTVVTLVATAALGYKFDHWSGDLLGTSLTIRVTLDSDKSITAHFKRIFNLPGALP